MLINDVYLSTLNYAKFQTTKCSLQEIIVQDAVSKVGNTKYNMFWQNCENFATYCRYGVNSSQQVCYFNL